jgi:hypothetical protein|tara:strand:+ start:5602 stop:5754 length:153 start_codon:yes stop_codon:yes gene_type:complete
MAFGIIRKLLYGTAKVLGDVNAVQKGKVGQRLVNRIMGKITGRFLGKFNK